MAIRQRVNDPYDNRTWLSMLGDMRANALEGKDPIAPRPVSTERASIRGIAPPPARSVVAETPGAPVRPSAMGAPELLGLPARPSATPMAGLRSQGVMKNEGTGEVFTAENAQTGFSRPGGMGLRGQGAFSVTDIAGGTVPQDAAAPAPTLNSGPLISGPTAGEQQAARQSAYGDKLFSPVDAANQYRSVGEGIRGKNYRQLYSDPGARSAAIARDSRVQDIMARKQMEADTNAAAVAQRPALQMLENQGRLDATTAAGQLDLQQADVTGQYGLRGRAAQDALYTSQADIAQRGTELFDQYQAEEDPVKKEGLRKAYNMLQGNQEPATKINFGEVTNADLTTTPIASFIDETGGLRVLREGDQGTGRPAPKTGEVVNGYRFKGGDPKSKDSWEKI